MAFSVRIANSKEFRAALLDVSREMGWSMRYAGLRAAKFMCFDSLVFTPPFMEGGGGGESKSAEMVGNRAVARDIMRIFTPMGRTENTAAAILFNRLAHAAKNKDQSAWYDAQEAAKAIVFQSDVVNKLVRDSNPVRAYKKAQNFFSKAKVMMTEGTDGKTKQGVLTLSQMSPIHDRLKRVTRQGRIKVRPGAGDYLGKYLVKDKGTLDAYVKKRQKEVGKTKAGWYADLISLPTPPARGREVRVTGKASEVASYIKRHAGNGAGYQRAFFNNRAASITIGNRIANKDNVSDRTNVQRLVFGRAIQRMEADLANEGERVRRKFNSGL